jgi:hypothetical protein
MTPAELHELVRPLWEADPALRPTLDDGAALRLVEQEYGIVEQPIWVFGGQPAGETVCDYSVAAALIEWHIDRAIEAAWWDDESNYFGVHATLTVTDHEFMHGRELATRIGFKVRFLAALRGVEVPR